MSDIRDSKNWGFNIKQVQAGQEHVDLLLAQDACLSISRLHTHSTVIQQRQDLL